MYGTRVVTFDTLYAALDIVEADPVWAASPVAKARVFAHRPQIEPEAGAIKNNAGKDGQRQQIAGREGENGDAGVLRSGNARGVRYAERHCRVGLAGQPRRE